MKLNGLWTHRDFMKLWMGETLSLFGSQLTLLALPLTAVVLLKATPREMGLLNTAAFAPFFLITLFAGAWLDKRHQRPVLIISNLARALLLICIPLGYWVGVIGTEYMMLIVFLIGVFSILFELSYQSYLPTLLSREQLVEGNSKLFASASIAEIGGPGLAGLIIQVFSAPVALALDAVTFLIASVSLASIRHSETKPSLTTQKLWDRIWDGLRLTLGNTYLRTFCLEATTYNFFNQAFVTLFVLYATHELGFDAGTIGLLFAIGSIGALIGSLVADRIGRQIGMGRTMSIGALVSCLAPLLIPLAPPSFPFPALTVGFFISGLSVTITNVHVFSIRQAMMPPDKRARIIASYRFISWGVIPFGALLSGELAEQIGLQPTLLLGAVGVTTACLWFIASPLARLRHVPTMLHDSETSLTSIAEAAIQSDSDPT